MNDTVQISPTATELTFRALRRHPDRIAFQWDDAGADSRLSYRGTLALIGRMQAALRAAGLGRGRRMAMLGANRAEVWCAANAAMALGVVVTWLHPMGSLDDHLSQVADGRFDALLIDVPSYRDRGGELSARCANVRDTFTVGPSEFGIDLLARAHAAGEHAPVVAALPDDPMILNYTGGTTGKSKAASRRHRSSGAAVMSILSDFEFPALPRYLAVAPITHVAGTKVLPCLLRGGTVHLVRGFDPEKVLRTIADQRMNTTLLVPTMIYMLLDHPALPRTDLSSLQLLMYGASPMSPTRLVEGLERIGPVFSQLYGQTECYPVSVLSKADHDAAHPELFASCGQPVVSAQVALLDDELQPVAAGEAGEICVRSVHVMDAYFERPELTEDTFRGGWLHTGDVARADDRGYLYIVDRKKDMIVTGGFNVFPREVEDALTTHAGVAQAAVIGVPDPKWGEAVAAFVVRKPGAEVDAQTLMQLVRERKGPQQAPKRVEFVDALPSTAVGKVDKKVLRARFWEGQQRQVG